MKNRIQLLYNNIFKILIMLLLLGCFTAIAQEQGKVNREIDSQVIELQILENPLFNYVVAWSPDGKTLAIAGGSLTYLYDTETLEEIGVLEGHTDFITTLDWNLTSTLLATGGWDDTVRIWDIATSKTITVFSEFDEQQVTSIAWHPTRNLIATSSFDFDRNLLIWNPLTGDIVQNIPVTIIEVAERTVVDSVDWSPDGTKIASDDGSGSLLIWDATTGNLLFNEKVHLVSSHDIEWSPDGQMIAFDNAIIDAESMEMIPLSQDSVHTDWVVSVSWSPDGRFLATNSLDDTTHIHDIWRQTTIAVLENSIDAYYYSMVNFSPTIDWSPDGRYLASVGNDNLLRMWDVSPLVDGESE